MKAVWYERNGAAEDVLVSGEMPKPKPARGEVLVRVHASGVNPSDVKARAGATRKIAFPRIVPDSDGAGIIEGVGPDVASSRVGQRVWLYNAQWERPFGTAAEYVCVPSRLAPPLADRLDFAEGACLGIPVMTAYRCLCAEGPVKDLNVLVTGGAGVVGHYAIQLARWMGARTIAATVSGPDKASHARAAGADVVINYRTEDVGTKLLEATGGSGVDRVVDVDLGGNFPHYLKALAPHASVAAYASMGRQIVEIPFYQIFRANLAIRPVLVYSLAEGAIDEIIAGITAWCESGNPKFAIAARLPLADVIAAHSLVEAGEKLGHVVLDIS